MCQISLKKGFPSKETFKADLSGTDFNLTLQIPSDTERVSPLLLEHRVVQISKVHSGPNDLTEEFKCLIFCYMSGGGCQKHTGNSLRTMSQHMHKFFYPFRHLFTVCSETLLGPFPCARITQISPLRQFTIQWRYRHNSQVLHLVLCEHQCLTPTVERGI